MSLNIPDEARKAAWDEFWYQSTAGADPEQALIDGWSLCGSLTGSLPGA